MIAGHFCARHPRRASGKRGAANHGRPARRDLAGSTTGSTSTSSTPSPTRPWRDVSNGKGGASRDQFAHVHNVRLMWLKAAAPELLEGWRSSETKAEHDKARLRGAGGSGRAIGALLAQGGRRRAARSRDSSRTHGVPRLPDRARVAPPRPGRLDPEADRPPPRPEDRLRPLGVGRAMTRRGRDDRPPVW